MKHRKLVKKRYFLVVLYVLLFVFVLQSIPMFLPIMRGTLNLPAARDPEVLERLDPNGLYRLAHRYQTHLNQCATLVADDQALLEQKIREVSHIVACDTNLCVCLFTQVVSPISGTFLT